MIDEIVTKKLLKNGRLTVPLFHGTSSLFIRSIIDYGLGAKNPINKYQVIRTLKSIFDLINVEQGNNLDWVSSRWMYERYIQQASSDRANWQHGEVYLTPSESKAASYACGNKYGSELISETFKLIDEYLSDVVLSKEEHPLLDLRFENARPVVIRIDAIPVEYLAPECERSMESQLKDMEKGIENPMLQFLWSQMNFRLIKPLGKESFSVVHIEAGEST